MPADHDASAKSSILEAAQRLFALEGFEKVSLRMLTQEAGVNLAAVNYHFGSKQALIEAVIRDYVNPVNEARLAALDRAEAAAGGAPVPIETILECFMKPVLEAVRKSDLSERLFFQLMGRCLNDQSLRALPDSVIAMFRTVLGRFPQAIGRALPELPEAEIIWRLHFSAGVLIHVLIHTEGLLHVAADRVQKPSPSELLLMVHGFCRSGFLAPPTAAFPVTTGTPSTLPTEHCEE